MNSKLIHPIIMDLIPHRFRRDIDEAIDAVGEVYNSSKPDPFELDFENYPILMYAYFYRYFVCISSAISASWHRLAVEHWGNLCLDEVNEWNVCCIGGGSGCDLVGYCKFLDKFKLRMKLNAVILDYYDWSDKTRNLLTNIEGSHLYNIANFKFVRFNFFKPITAQIASEIHKADLVTIVKFMSAVGSCAENTERLKNLLSRVKKGAYVFLMDNLGGDHGLNMKKAASEANLHFVEEKRLEVNINEEESKSMTLKRFHTLPLKTTKVIALLYIRFYSV